VILFCIAQRHFWNAACPALCRIFDDPGLRVVKLIHTSWAIVSLINIGIAYSVSWLQFGLDDPGFKSRQRQGFFFTILPDRLWGLPTLQWGQGQFYLYRFFSLFVWNQTLISPFGVSKLHICFIWQRAPSSTTATFVLKLGSSFSINHFGRFVRKLGSSFSINHFCRFVRCGSCAGNSHLLMDDIST
jgi:hypothetical protein